MWLTQAVTIMIRVGSAMSVVILGCCGRSDRTMNVDIGRAQTALLIGVFALDCSSPCAILRARVEPHHGQWKKALRSAETTLLESMHLRCGRYHHQKCTELETIKEGISAINRRPPDDSSNLICVRLKHLLYDFFRGCLGPLI